MADVALRVDGKRYGGWKSVSISLGLEQLVGTFTVSASALAPNGDAATALQPGSLVEVLVDNQVVITGYIDDLNIEHSASDHRISVSGRDKAADLIDCAAMNQPGEWNNKDMLAIVSDLCAPFGITARSTVPVGKPFAQWNIEPGETVFENIDRLARHRGVLVVSDGVGGVLLTQPGADTISTALVLGENILSGTLSASHQQRFSDYTVKGQRPRDDENEGALATQISATVKDSDVTRHRPTLLMYEDADASKSTLANRAAWQRDVNAARAQRVSITVQGFSHASGLWSLNKLVSVTDARLRLNNVQLLIVGITWSLDASGTRTELQLMPRNALQVDVLPDSLLEPQDAA